MTFVALPTTVLTTIRATYLMLLLARLLTVCKEAKSAATK
jgi:hypothetical protein